MAFLNQMLLNRMRTEEPSAASIEKIRRLDLERHDRIFDPKVRTIGIDKTALDAQVEEKSRLQQVEADRENFYATQAVAMDHHAMFLQAQREAEAGLEAKDLEAYRKQFQKKQAAREWDINDPQSILKDIPARIGDNDPRCGASSMQQFYGEDLGGTERRKKQQEQQKKWVQMQQDEKNLMLWLEAEKERKYAERQNEISHRGWELAGEVERHRKTMNNATAGFNSALARQKQAEKQANKEQDTLDSLEHIRNVLDSDMMMENPMTTISSKNPNRFRPDHMKGFAPEQRTAILNAQATQQEELLERRAKEAEDEQRWALQEAKIHAMACAMDDEKARLRRLGLQQLEEDHRLQVAAADQRRKEERTRTRPDIGDDWWGKFNVGTR